MNFFKHQIQMGCLIASTLILTACGKPTSPSSRPHEAPDRYNKPAKLGLSGPFSWDDVKGPDSYSLDFTPWTDTYWPTSSKGLARRYTQADPQGVDLFSYHKFLVRYFAAIDTGNDDDLATLSPAEKHDILANDDFTSFGTMTRVQLLKQAKAIDDELEGALKKIGHHADTIAARHARIAAIKQAASAIKTLTRHSGIAAQLPTVSDSWGDWSSVVAGARNRVHTRSLMIDGTDLIDPDARDWGWEGICHGWAPAAIFSAEPKHAVMAVKADGTRVLFFEGDIRALLSKSWADQSPPTDVFLGGRCEASEDALATDAYGRTHDAKIICERCGQWNDRAVHFVKEFSSGSHTVIQVVTWNEPNSPSGFLVLRGDARRPQDVLAFDDLASLETWIRTQDPELEQVVELQTQRECRDVNPMAFHLLLTQVMPTGQGFVMDRTRTMQVWNQPVKGYRLKYEAIDTSLNAADQLTPIDQIVDPYWRFRAPGTRFLINATAELHWITENGPYISYGEGVNDIDEGAVRRLTLKYTLEFDENRHLIGGEWGHVPPLSQDSDNRAYDPSTRRGQAPDFIYYFKPGTEPLNRHQRGAQTVNYDKIVKALHMCSLQDGPLKEYRPRGLSVKVRYNECPLE